jgi:hypothetical protein
LIELEIAEQEGERRRWSVADLVPDLGAGNPHADPHGHAAVWCFLDPRDGPRLLPESVPELSGRRELQAWRDGDTPSVFVNSSEQPVKVWTELPPRKLFVHPGPQGPVALAWISPLDGVVSIRGRIADAHPGGSDGVDWRLEHFAAAEVGHVLVGQGEYRRHLTEPARRRAELNARRPVMAVAYAVSEGTPQHARIQRRGDPANLGEEVPRKFLDLCGGQPVAATDTSGRLELAQWLTDPANPLTPRVIVNRMWQWHFGRGLVATPNDFGTRGAEPTHPQLLDHLAAEFVQSGWRWKALHRRILLSATYQQASGSSQGVPRYASFPRRRLTAEELRDTLLVASGELDRTPGAAHPFPPEATWSFSQHAPFAAEYETLQRSVYVMQKRNRRGRFFALFDGPDPNASTPQRDLTTVPTQALFFLNDPFLHAQAAKFAARILAASSEERARLDFASGILCGRAATEDEQQDAAAFLQEYAAAVADRPAVERPAAAWEAYARVLLGSNEVLHVD